MNIPKKGSTLMANMNSRQWAVRASVLGPVELASSSITDPANSSSRTIRYDNDQSIKRSENFTKAIRDAWCEGGFTFSTWWRRCKEVVWFGGPIVGECETKKRKVGRGQESEKGVSSAPPKSQMVEEFNEDLSLRLFLFFSCSRRGAGGVGQWKM